MKKNPTPSVTKEMIEAGLAAMEEAESTPFLNPPNRYLVQVALEAALKSSAPQHTGLTGPKPWTEIMDIDPAEEMARKLDTGLTDVERAIAQILQSHMTHGWDKAAREIAALLVSGRSGMEREALRQIAGARLPSSKGLWRAAFNEVIQIARTALDIPTVDEGEGQ